MPKVHNSFKLVLKGCSLAIAERLPYSMCHVVSLGPVVLLYHAVSDVTLPHVEHLSKIKTIREFESDLDYLLKKFCPINIDELRSFILKGIPLPERAFYLTFDDGLQEIGENVAPILRKRGLPAAFFINSGFLDNQDMSYRHKVSLLIGRAREPKISQAMEKEIGTLFRTAGLKWTGDLALDLKNINYRRRGLIELVAEKMEFDFKEFLHRVRPYLNSNQVLSLVADGFSIGSHSVDHPNYSELNFEEQLRQTREGAHQLAEKIGVDHKLFAFPFSEEGISRNFYRSLIEDGTVELFFGTSACVHRTAIRQLGRICLEGNEFPEKVLKRSMMDGRLRGWLKSEESDNH